MGKWDSLLTLKSFAFEQELLLSLLVQLELDFNLPLEELDGVLGIDTDVTLLSPKNLN